LEHPAPEKKPGTEKVRFIKEKNYQKHLKIPIMNTQLSNSSFTQEVKDIVAGFITRTKTISAADVWNIQRQKRSRVQRRFAL
jgi:hypothetical protein